MYGSAVAPAGTYGSATGVPPPMYAGIIPSAASMTPNVYGGMTPGYPGMIGGPMQVPTNMPMGMQTPGGAYQQLPPQQQGRPANQYPSRH